MFRPTIIQDCAAARSHLLPVDTGRSDRLSRVALEALQESTMANETADRHLARAYGSGDAAAVRDAYAAWAASYDEDVAALGYRNPTVVAALVARHLPDLAAPLLDAGAGTGILGEFLAILGYRHLVAIDLSAEMLARAEQRGAYRALHVAMLGTELPFSDRAFGAVAASGVFTPGHAPPESFDELLRITRTGGRLIFTVSAPALAQGFDARMTELEQEGRWRRVEATLPFHPTPGTRETTSVQAQGFVYEVLR